MIAQPAPEENRFRVIQGFRPKRTALDGEPDLLTVQRMHELSGLSEQTIRRELNSGRLPGCRIGRRLYVLKDEFIAYARGGGGIA